jgi:hypothetical protein
MSYQDLQALLRADALSIAMAVILVSAGIAAILLFSIRVLKRDYALLLFGLFATLYGSRLFLTVPGSPAAPPGPRPTSQLLLAIAPNVQRHIYPDLTIPLPVVGFLFCAQILGDTIRQRRLVRFLIVHAPMILGATALATDLFFRRALPVVLTTIGLFSSGTITVVATLLVRDIFRLGRRPKPEMRALAIGFVIMGLFVVHANLTFFGLPGPNLEPVGFFIFIWVLGYVVVLRGIRNEEQLLAVRNELEIARQIQSSILPQKLPEVAGAEIAVCYAPMKAIGGDFYEFLPVDDQRVGILIADVSGHGVPAALMASMVKVAVFAQMANAARPSQLLAGLNKVLCGNLRGQYVTAVYLFLDAENRKLACACAGHPPPLVWDRATGTSRFVGENGLMMGFFPDAEFRTTEAAWNPGDRCLLYTDGVVEAENSAEVSFGADRLKEQMNTADGSAPKRLSEHLLEAVASWRGRGRDDPQDDITIIAVQFPAAGSAQVRG